MTDQNQRYSSDIVNKISDRTNSDDSSEQKFPSIKPMTDDSSQGSISTRFYYENICIACIISNSIRSGQKKRRQIDADLLYAYDPFRKEVETTINSLKIEYYDRYFLNLYNFILFLYFSKLDYSISLMIHNKIT